MFWFVWLRFMYAFVHFFLQTSCSWLVRRRGISPKCSFSCPSIIMHKAWKTDMSSDQNRNCLPYIPASFFVGSINMLFWWCQNLAIVGNGFFLEGNLILLDYPKRHRVTRHPNAINEGSPEPEPIRIRDWKFVSVLFPRSQGSSDWLNKQTIDDVAVLDAHTHTHHVPGIHIMLKHMNLHGYFYLLLLSSSHCQNMLPGNASTVPWKRSKLVEMWYGTYIPSVVRCIGKIWSRGKLLTRQKPCKLIKIRIFLIVIKIRMIMLETIID